MDALEYLRLVDRINDLDQTYYSNPDECVISDSKYDYLFDRLLAYEEETGHVAFASPSKRPGGKSTLNPTKHQYPMLSLAKVTTSEDLAKFLAKFEPGTELMVQPKFDGASLSLQYENGRLVSALTRGDGATGDDVTANALCIRGIDPSPGKGFTGVVRGEVVIPSTAFVEINAEGRFANARNAAAGALRHSDPQEARRRRLLFIPYDYVEMAGTCSVELTEGVNVTPDRVQRAVEMILEGRDQLDYEIDGVVIKSGSVDVRNAMGATGRHPNWAVAFKTQGDVVETKLLDVTWQVGTGGGITPVAELEPVECMGTVISRATMHNPKFIEDGGYLIGDTVLVTRAGDVIPYLVGVAGTAIEPRTIDIPVECPDCGAKLEQRGNSGQVKCLNVGGCEKQVVARIQRWASRDAADIDGLSTKMIEKLIAAELVSSIVDLYTLTVEDFMTLDRVGKKSAEKLVKAIANSRGLGMRRAIIGFAIPHVGEGTAKRLCQYLASVHSLERVEPSDLMTIDDIGPEVAHSIVDWINDGWGAYLPKKLADLGLNLDRLPEDAPVERADGAASVVFVVTGSVPGYKTRKDFIADLEASGWTSQTSVTKKTDVLILEDPSSTSSKATKARDLGVEIITPEEAARRANGS